MTPLKHHPRSWMILALMMLAGVFVWPLWQITLEAAQFPGGLRLLIWIDRLSGDDGTADIVQNINILNHYIGMQCIHPDSIPELQYFPKVVYAMLGLGAIVLWINRWFAYAVWLGIMSILGALGIYDFYLWLYDYGHNLDPNAPIKIEGMSFMPPLLGEKDLLNFYVKSYPHGGAIALGLSLGSALVATWKSKLKK